jgi:acyl carrier protein
MVERPGAVLPTNLAAGARGMAMIDDKLRKILGSHVLDAGTVDHLRPDDELVEIGIDSLRLVELILDLEDAYQIVIPDEDMVPENFATVGAVAALVDRLLPVR